MQHSNPLVIGLNCALGASQMVPFMQALSDAAECFVHSYPNAGLPNAMGGYDEEPESFAESLKQFCELGLVNMLGGCCGIQPAHIDALDKMLLKMKYKPREPAKKPQHMWLSGLEAIDVEASNSYLNIGERCNIAGSIKFKKVSFVLIRRHTPFAPYVAPRFPHMSEINSLFSLSSSSMATTTRDSRSQRRRPRAAPR